MALGPGFRFDFRPVKVAPVHFVSHHDYLLGDLAVSSAGLRAILLTAKSSATGTPSSHSASLSDQIREVFTTSGFDKVIAIHSSKAEALAFLHD